MVITLWNMVLKSSFANDTTKTYVYNTIIPEKYRPSYSELNFYLERSAGSHLFVSMSKGTNQFLIKNITGKSEPAGSTYNGEVVYIQF